MKVWRFLGLALVCAAASSVAVAAPQREAAGEAASAAATGKVVYAEQDGRAVALTPRPERVVVLLNSILDLWYLAGGTAIARVEGTTNVPPEAMDIENLGSFGSPNTERLFALRPDLVIFTSSSAAQAKVRDLVDQAGIETVSIAYTNYDDFVGIMDLFTSLTGRRDLYDSLVASVQKRVEAVLARLPKQGNPTVFILFSSSKSLSAELPSGDTGLILEALGGKNIVTSSPVENATRMDFSMEQVVARSPEVILIKTMGEVEACKARIDKEITGTAAWKDIAALRSGRVHYLPKDLFMYKPNARYAEAYEYLAKILYPEVFGRVE